MTDKPKVKPEVKPEIPKKPDEISHPDPLKRYKALKEWRKKVNEITGEDEVMKYDATKSIEKAPSPAEKEAKAVQKEVEVPKIGDAKIKLTKAEQLAELIRIKKEKKAAKVAADKAAAEAKKKKKKIDN